MAFREHHPVLPEAQPLSQDSLALSTLPLGTYHLLEWPNQTLAVIMASVVPTCPGEHIPKAAWARSCCQEYEDNQLRGRRAALQGLPVALFLQQQKPGWAVELPTGT